MTLSDEDHLLAGEYVLGTLDLDSRAAVAKRRLADAAFDIAIVDWENRLSCLDEVAPEVNPPETLWRGIKARIGAGQGTVPPMPDPVPLAGLRRQIRMWQRVAGGSLALAAALALWIAVDAFNPAERPSNVLMAVLEPSSQAPAFLVKADLDDRAMSVQSMTAPAMAGHSYQLWMIDPSLSKPKSLGLLSTAAVSRTALPQIDPAILARATYAVTVEPEGGSPTGGPSGPPVFVGHLRRSKL